MLEVDPASSEEKSEKGETSSDELNQLRAQEHSTTGTPNKDSLESEEHESLISNNIDKKLSYTKSGMNSSPKSSAVEHDHGN